MSIQTPQTAVGEHFRDRKLWVKTSDDALDDSVATREKLSQSLRQSWETEVARFKQETGQDLGTYRPGQVTKDGVLGVLRKQYGDSKEAKKKEEFFGTVEKVLNGVELIASIAADAASVVFGPAQMCFGALEILFSIPKAFKSSREDLQALFKEVSGFLGLFNVYDRLDQRGMLHPALVISNHELLITLVDVCMLAWKAITHSTRTVLGNVLLKDKPIAGALDKFRDLIKKQNELTSTMTLEAVLEDGALSRKILSRTSHIEQRTRRIEESTTETNIVSKDTNVVVKRLAADSLENKNLKVDRDRIAQIDRAFELTDAAVSGPLDELRQPRMHNLEAIIAVLENITEYKEWDDFAQANETRDRRLLYIGGEAKSGKTKLLSALVQQIEMRKKKMHSDQKDTAKDKQQKDDRSIYISYYSFQATAKSKDRGKFDTPVHAALKTMAAQVARQSTSYSNTLMERLESLQKGQKTIKQLWESLKLTDFGAPPDSILYMFFDGIDQLKSNLPELGSIMKMRSLKQESKDNQSKLKLRIVFTGKSNTVSQLEIDPPSIFASEINQPLIKQYVEFELQDRYIFQDNDEDSKLMKAQVLDLIPENSQGSFDIAKQKLKMLEEAIEEDIDSESLVENLKSATFNTLADEGREILDHVSANLSEQHREQLKELLMWTIWGRSAYELKLLEAALFLQREKKSLEPLRRKLEERFEKVFHVYGENAYPHYVIEEAIQYSSSTKSAEDGVDKKSEISVNIAVTNADESSVKQFFWDLNQRIADGTFNFSRQGQTTAGVNRLMLSESQVQFTIITRLLRALNDDRVRRQAAALIEYATEWLPYHLSEFTASHKTRPIAEVQIVGKGIVNFLSDEETITAAWDQSAFDAYEWMREEYLQAFRTLLRFVKDDLDPIERRWAGKHTASGSTKAAFLFPMMKVVAYKWLVDRSRKVEARKCYDFLDRYLEMLAEPDFDDDENDTTVPSRTTTPVPDAVLAETDHNAQSSPPTERTPVSGVNHLDHDGQNSPVDPADTLPPITSSDTKDQSSSTETATSSNTLQMNGNPEPDSTPLDGHPTATSLDESGPPKIVNGETQTEDRATNTLELTQTRSSLPRQDEIIQPLSGNFSATSSDIELVKDSILLALCITEDGREVQAAINLNDCLENHRGKLKWRRDGHALDGARQVRLAQDGQILEARIHDDRAHTTWSRIALDEQISNKDGKLVFLDTALEDKPVGDDAKNSSEPDEPLSSLQRLKRAETWAVTTLNLKLDSFAFERLGHAAIDDDTDVAMEYFNKVEPNSKDLWKSIGLATAFERKGEYQKAMDSIQVALDEFRAEDGKNGAREVSKTDRLDYNKYAQVTDLFTCLVRAADYQRNLKNQTAAMDLMEEALKCRPWACDCRWEVLLDLCRDSQHDRAQALFDDWKTNAHATQIDTPSKYVLKIVGDLQTITYISRGTALQTSIEEAIREAMKEAEAESRDEDNISLLYCYAVVFATRDDPASKELARKSWMEAISIGREIGLRDTSWMEYCSFSIADQLFDSALAQLNSQQPKDAQSLLSKLEEDITPWAVQWQMSTNFIDQAKSYVISFALLTDQLDYAKALLKPDMTDAISILSDDDVNNDDTGIQLLIKILVRMGDSSGALAAFSLLDRLETRQRLREKFEKQAEERKKKSEEPAGWDEKPASGAEQSTDNETKIAEDTAEPDATPPEIPPLSEEENEVNKYWFLQCQGCWEYQRSWDEDFEMWWCRYCPATQFCTPCKDKLLQNKQENLNCNPQHEFMLIKHAEYELEDIKGDDVRIGGTIRTEEVKVEAEGENESKMVTKLTREGGQVIKLEEWIEMLKKEWDITETTKIEGKVQQ